MSARSEGFGVSMTYPAAERSSRPGAAGLIVAALALVALASGRGSPRAVPVQRAPVPRASATAVAALRDGQRIDLNHAGLADLMLLPGVGPKLAQRILDERARRGGYARIDELLDVKGIGPATLLRLSRFVTIPDRATGPRAATR